MKKTRMMQQHFAGFDLLSPLGQKATLNLLNGALFIQNKLSETALRVLAWLYEPLNSQDVGHGWLC